MRIQPAATDVIGRMTTTYALARSYIDHGEVTTVYSGARPHTIRAPFTTAFERPDRFRFEFSNGYDPRPAFIWMSGGKVQSYRPGSIERPATLESAAFYSRIPRLLLPSRVPVRGLDALKNPRLDGTELVEGHPCLRVAATWPRGGDITLWIDQATYLLRRTTERRHFAPAIDTPAFDVVETTTYEPTLNGDVPDSLLRGPDPSRLPPPAQDPWIGVQFDGARIAHVFPGSPAERAGVRTDDVIVAADGTPVSGLSDLIPRLRGKAVGATVALTVRRDGHVLTLPVELGDRLDFLNRQHLLIGKPAPRFTESIVTGASSTSNALAGATLLVLAFGPTSFAPCAGCEPPATFFSKLQDKYGPRGLRVIGVSEEDAATLRNAVANHHLHYALAHDDGYRMADSYYVVFPATVVFIDKSGIIRWIQRGTAGLEFSVERLLGSR